ncbi:transposase [Collimonas arenae]
MSLRDDHWKKLEPLLLGSENEPGVTGRNNRLFIDAILWKLAGSGTWPELPSEFGKWNTAYMRFRRWSVSGFWHQLMSHVSEDLELRAIIEEISAYGDRVLMRVNERSFRRESRKINGSKKEFFRSFDESKISEDSPLHWVDLMSDSRGAEKKVTGDLEYLKSIECRNLRGIEDSASLQIPSDGKSSNCIANTTCNPNRLLDTLIVNLCLRNDAELARKLKISPPVISKIRNHQIVIGASVLIKMHDASGLSIKELRALLGEI